VENVENASKGHKITYCDVMILRGIQIKTGELVGNVINKRHKVGFSISFRKSIFLEILEKGIENRPLPSENSFTCPGENRLQAQRRRGKTWETVLRALSFRAFPVRILTYICGASAGGHSPSLVYLLISKS
jgi:hypothetical protein